MAERSEQNSRPPKPANRNQERYADLARQNREGHEQVERSLREAERIASQTRRVASAA